MKQVSKEQCITSINTNENVLIKVTSDWCGPCKIMDKIIDQISVKYENVIFISVDVEESHENVSSLPTLFLYKNGKMINTKSGSMSGSVIEELIQSSFN